MRCGHPIFRAALRTVLFLEFSAYGTSPLTVFIRQQRRKHSRIVQNRDFFTAKYISGILTNTEILEALEFYAVFVTHEAGHVPVSVELPRLGYLGGRWT